MSNFKNQLDLVKLHVSRSDDLDVFPVLTEVLIQIDESLIPPQVLEGYLGSQSPRHTTNVVCKELRAAIERLESPKKQEPDQKKQRAKKEVEKATTG